MYVRFCAHMCVYLRNYIALRRSEGECLYQHVKDRANRMQSQACLGYAEVQPMFEAQPQRSLVIRITTAKVEFNYSTQKFISVEFSVERPKMPANAFVYRQ